MRVRTAISLAFGMAIARYPQIHSRWTTASIQIGFQLPNSSLMASLQRCGRVDMLLRAMEDEFQAEQAISPEDTEFMSDEIQGLLSEDWIGAAYEITRLRKERKLVQPDSQEVGLARVLHILRMPLDKHEIADDKRLKLPLEMHRTPPSGEPRDLYTYDRSDPKRSHIMPAGVSDRGSLMWHAIDGKTLESGWFERRAIADALLDVWAPAGPAASASASAAGE